VNERAQGSSDDRLRFHNEKTTTEAQELGPEISGFNIEGAYHDRDNRSDLYGVSRSAGKMDERPGTIQGVFFCTVSSNG
jgi:hypothetical protein